MDCKLDLQKSRKSNSTTTVMWTVERDKLDDHIRQVVLFFFPWDSYKMMLSRFFSSRLYGGEHDNNKVLT